MQTDYIDYHSNGLTMRGFVARNTTEAEQPLVLIVHDWSGCRELAEEKAKYFAKQGFVGFAVDLYGIGRRGSDTDKSINQDLMSEVMADRAVIVTRLQAALDTAKQLPHVAKNKIMVIGFCFGGLCALDFARSGAEVTGVVSVHGVLLRPETTGNAKINAKILALHGYEDKSEPPGNLAEFHAEMASRGADWQTHVFGNTMHAFTNPKANDPAAGLMFNSLSDSRTWAIVKTFTDEIFA